MHLLKYELLIFYSFEANACKGVGKPGRNTSKDKAIRDKDERNGNSGSKK